MIETATIPPVPHWPPHWFLIDQCQLDHYLVHGVFDDHAPVHDPKEWPEYSALKLEMQYEAITGGYVWSCGRYKFPYEAAVKLHKDYSNYFCDRQQKDGQ